MTMITLLIYSDANHFMKMLEMEIVSVATEHPVLKEIYAMGEIS